MTSKWSDLARYGMEVANFLGFWPGFWPARDLLFIYYMHPTLTGTPLMRVILLSILGSLALLPARAVKAQGLTDGEGRPYDLRVLRGRVVVLTFGSPATKDEVGRVNLALEARAQSTEVAVVSVVDLSAIPSLFHGYACRKVAESQRERRIKLLVDERGSLRQPLRVQPDRQVDILVIDQQGTVRGRFRGEGEVSQTLTLLAELQKAPQAVALR